MFFVQNVNKSTFLKKIRFFGGYPLYIYCSVPKGCPCIMKTENLYRETDTIKECYI